MVWAECKTVGSLSFAREVPVTVSRRRNHDCRRVTPDRPRHGALEAGHTFTGSQSFSAPASGMGYSDDEPPQRG